MLMAENNVSAWNLLKEKCHAGYQQKIERGSFEHENIVRLQCLPTAVEIANPLDFETLPKDITVGMIEKYYFDYIVSADTASDNEEYTYAERIAVQLPTALEMLRESPGTNQASISISQPSDVFLEHPPCLREISFSVAFGTLHVSTFWRSNDIGHAFVINQGGISLLLKDAAGYAGLSVGRHYYFCSNAHVYDRK